MMQTFLKICEICFCVNRVAGNIDKPCLLKIPVLLIRIRIDLLSYIRIWDLFGNADPDPGAQNFTKINK
jgi:hypothetical protein